MNEVALTSTGAVAIPPTAELAATTYLDIRRNGAKYPRVNAVTPEAATLTIKATILKMVVYTGRQIEDTQVQYMAVNLYDLLMADEEGCGTAYLSFAEIEKVLRKAVFGRAKNEMFGINVASIYRALTDYCIGEGQAAARILEKEKEKAEIASFKRTSIGIAIDCKAVELAKARRINK